MAKFSGMLMLLKLRSKKLSKSRSSKLARSDSCCGGFGGAASVTGTVKWEVRPGGMLVQMREYGETSGSSESYGEVAETIRIKVSTGNRYYEIAIVDTSTIGDLKEVVSVVTGLERREQRLLFRGKEREDEEHLHMIGVRDEDKVVIFQDPTARKSKLGLTMELSLVTAHCPAIIQV